MRKKEKGKFGEKIAREFLKRKGWEILCENWTCRWGEIDIISKINDVVVFVEVKYRSSNKFGYAFEAINFRKKKSLFRSIQRFLAESNLKSAGWRLDVICVSGKSGGIKIDHYENVSIM